MLNPFDSLNFLGLRSGEYEEVGKCGIYDRDFKVMFGRVEADDVVKGKDR